MRKENLKNVRLVLVIGLAVMFRLINLNQSFWLDEAAQVIESVRPLGQQFDLVADFHPPLYHLLIHFWLFLGRSEIWVRLLSVGLGVGSVILIYQLGKLLFDKKTALVSALFLAISPYHIWYSQEARPYIAFLFLSLLATFFLIRKRWVGYVIALIFSLYTHYFTFFMMISHAAYIFLFDKRNLRKFLTASGISLITFAVWMPELFQQLTLGTGGRFTGWTGVVSTTPVKTAALIFAKFIFGRGSIDNNFLYSLVILPVFLMFVMALIKIWKERQGKILVILFAIPFLTAEIVSVFVPINAVQRLIFLLPIFSLILAAGILHLSRRMQLVALLIVIITSIGGIYQYYTDESVQREQWRQAVKFTEQSPDEKSATIFVFPGPFAPFTWYTKLQIDAWGIAPKFILTDSDLTNMSVKLSTKNKLYLYQYLTGLTDPQNKTQKFLSLSGFTQTDVRNFPGVGFIYIYER